ncbi:MAG: L-threonylcarbamoyladenylate synthase [Alphaproteobacteria bacterium]|nr:L-threonylcarbamoyladenylate synthase [Alphaproteobacteria bacterium]
MTDLHDEIFIKKLNAHLRAGGVIAFPTDTVWGLGALPNAVGAAALFKIKHRPTNKHLIIMSDTIEHIAPYMTHHPARAFKMAHKYWPGALTIGVPVADDADTCVFGGVRIPNYKPFHDLCNIIDGYCLATSSANISGQPVLTNPDEIRKTFPDIIIIDNAYQPMGGAPSTVVVLDGDKTNIVRQGAVIIDKK